MSEDIRAALLAAIRGKAYKEGDFTLASGQKSTYYIDCKEVTLDAVGALLVGRMMLEKIIDWNADAVGGLELGSVPISTAISVVSASSDTPLGNIIVRKEQKGHGAGKKIEGPIKPGLRIVIVEDVVSTGGSSMKAVEALRDAGADIVGVVAIVDREMGGADLYRNAGLRVEPLFTLSELRSS
jgi:orotate phosphoribosyltransferase